MWMQLRPSILAACFTLTVAAVSGCGGGAGAEPLTPDAHDPSSAAPAPSTIATERAPVTSSAGTDLSTPEKAKAAIYSALQAGDKEAFKKCVTKQNLAKHEKSFDGWFDVWKSAAARGPDAFKSIRLAQEDGAWKLDEN